MMMTQLYSGSNEEVKEHLVSSFRDDLEALFLLLDEDATPLAVEMKVWELLLKTGRNILASLFALLCRRATAVDIERRGLWSCEVSIRSERDYWPTVTTTMGPVTFPWFAYRERRGPASVTRVPARKMVFPLHRKCRSSELCLQWETCLGADHPFRRAQEALGFFTHGAVRLEDTTIARHMVRIGNMVERDWLFASVERIKEVLRTRATRDRQTGRPILYFSTDAHALRRYVDESWDPAWKMVNGLRLWCIDRHNGAVIHLGGEYTWGDCHYVADIVRWLIECGRLPADGDYGDGLVARFVLVTDGAEWIETHIAPLFTEPVPILDVYHVMERLSEYAALRYKRGSKKAKAWYEDALFLLLGHRNRRRRSKASPRKGHRKQRRRPGADPQPSVEACNISPRAPGRAPAAEALLYFIEKQRILAEHEEARENLLGYIDNNAHRMDYIRYRRLGYQIGSGAMESLHRTASQVRLKIPGGRWLRTTSQAILNLRMLMLSGRWDEFWKRPDLTNLLVDAFERCCDASDSEAA